MHTNRRWTKSVNEFISRADDLFHVAHLYVMKLLDVQQL